ncbi:MAG: hypothetical protein LUH14_04000 [Clostridiaceae bacterium]|nr:hypothetical protein [Clostridiaceae bacterium]
MRQEKKYYIGREGKSETWGDYFSLRKAGMGRSRRNYTLGAAYTVEMIKKRLAAYQKPLRNFTMENEEIFLLYSIPFVKRERVAAYNEYQLHFYREMLKYGTRSRSQPVDHKLIRNSLKEIKLLQEEMRLIERHHIQNKGDILSVLSGIQDDFRELEEQRQQVKKEWTVYQPVVKQWTVLQRLMPDTKEYKDVLHGLEKYPYSLDEIAQYYQSYKSKLAGLRKKKRELQGRQAAWKRILVRLENGIPADAEKRCMETYDKLYSMYGAPNKIKKVKKEESVKWNRK